LRARSGRGGVSFGGAARQGGEWAGGGGKGGPNGPRGCRYDAIGNWDRWGRGGRQARSSEGRRHVHLHLAVYPRLYLHRHLCSAWSWPLAPRLSQLSQGPTPRIPSLVGAELIVLVDGASPRLPQSHARSPSRSDISPNSPRPRPTHLLGPVQTLEIVVLLRYAVLWCVGAGVALRVSALLVTSPRLECPLQRAAAAAPSPRAHSLWKTLARRESTVSVLSYQRPVLSHSSCGSPPCCPPFALCIGHRAQTVHVQCQLSVCLMPQPGAARSDPDDGQKSRNADRR
jgi:hypothetical protein